MKRKNWPVRIATAALALFVTTGAISATVAAGGQDDPLVTLSYLTQKLTPDILSAVDSKVQTQSRALEGTLADRIQGYIHTIEGLLQNGGGGSTEGDTYTVVSLQNGQTLTGGVGCEVMLRVGTAVCVSSSSPGLIDMTSGGTLNNGQSLVTNHLYLITIDSRSIRATAAVKVLVRGAYTIQ